MSKKIDSDKTKREKSSQKNLGGRPPKYSKKVCEEICIAIETQGKCLRDILSQSDDWPNKSNFLKWVNEHPWLKDRYAAAKKMQVTAFIDDILEISDDSSLDSVLNSKGELVYNAEYVNRSRLKVDTRKWIAAKMAPHLYGDSKQLEMLQEDNSQLKEELRELRAKLDSKNTKDY